MICEVFGAYEDLGIVLQGGRRCDRLGCERGAAGDAELAMAFDQQFQPCCALGSRHGGGVAIIDRFLETALGGTALEPGTAPALHRQVGHIGIDVDTRNETAAEPEASRNRVVVDLVLRLLGGVEGLDAVGAQIRFGHGSCSLRRL